MPVILTELVRGIALTCHRSPASTLLPDFNSKLIMPKMERKNGETFYVQGDKYFIEDKEESTTYYNAALKDDLVAYLKSYNTPIDEFKQLPTYVPQKVDFSNHTLSIKEPEDSPFVYQNGVIDFALKDDRRHIVLEVQTGRGKSAMAMKIAVELSYLTLLVTKASYIAKWIGDLTEEENSLALKKSEIVWLKTFDDLVGLIHYAQDHGGLKSLKKKVILASSHLIEGYLVKALSGGYDVVHPTKLAELLGIGLMILDESHQLFRMNYHSRIMLQMPYLIDLSATLKPNANDHFAIARYKEAFPKHTRYNKMGYNKYIDAISLYYRLRSDKIIGQVNRMPMYSHVQFEEKLMRDKRTKQRYFEMIEKIMQDFWKKDYQKGQKALVFFSLKKTCTDFQLWMKIRHTGMNVVRYIQGDNYEKFKECDIGISTYGKAGTAVDLKGLLLSIVTVPMSKDQANLQILGRTRVDRVWHKTPKVVFLHAKGITKHRRYDVERGKLFQGKVKNHITIHHTPFEV